MPRGGKRDGAGRKRGSPNKDVRTAKKYMDDGGKLPLDVLMETMRDAYDESQKATAELHELPKILPRNRDDAYELVLRAVRRAEGFKNVAQARAKDAAPFLHPRLNATEFTGDPENPIPNKITVELVRPKGQPPAPPAKARNAHLADKLKKK